MDSFIKSKNFLIKYLILELFEKLYRMTKYINTCEKFDRKNNNDKIIALFKESIEIVGKEVEKLCADVNTDLDPNAKFAYTLKISQNAKAIIRIHEQLKNLHSSWILPEIKTFTSEITKENRLFKEDINIILSDDYSFLERNLGTQFEKSLVKVYGETSEARTFSDNHSFILPKIEFSNPLNWTIIAHEAGHLLEQEISAIRDNPLIIPDGIQSIEVTKIKNWAEEIFCDIYATSILGPAYFISFVSFALLRTMDFGISSNSDHHPSILIRASIIANYLSESNLFFDSEWGIEDYCDTFYDCLMEQQSIFRDESKRIEGLTKFVHSLREEIKKLELNLFAISSDDAARIKSMVESLENGVPIGSVFDNNKADISYELEKEEVIDKEKLNQLKALMSERAAKTWEILNAGWVFKLENLCRRGEEIFFFNSEALEIKVKIDKYGEMVDLLDERLLASINTSHILKIIEM